MDLIQVLAGANTDWCTGTEIATIQTLVSTVILIIQIAIPLLLIIFGMLDLGKAVVASKEDDIKKGQQMFIKRLISAALVFLVIFIVKILISVLAPGGDTASEDTIWGCANKFINGPDSKSNSGGE